VAEAADHGSGVDAGGEEFGDVVVAKFVERGGDGETFGKPVVSLGHGVRFKGFVSVRGEGEQVELGDDLDAEPGGDGVQAGDVVAEYRHGVVVEGEAFAEQGAQFAASDPGGHRRPHRSAPLGVLPRFGEDPRGLLGGRWLLVLFGWGRGPDVLQRVLSRFTATGWSDLIAEDSPVQGAEGRGRQGLAGDRSRDTRCPSRAVSGCGA
jgi:hypothetical protein